MGFSMKRSRSGENEQQPKFNCTQFLDDVFFNSSTPRQKQCKYTKLHLLIHHLVDMSQFEHLSLKERNMLRKQCLCFAMCYGYDGPVARAHGLAHWSHRARYNTPNSKSGDIGCLASHVAINQLLLDHIYVNRNGVKFVGEDITRKCSIEGNEWMVCPSASLQGVVNYSTAIIAAGCAWVAAFRGRQFDNMVTNVTTCKKYIELTIHRLTDALERGIYDQPVLPPTELFDAMHQQGATQLLNENEIAFNKRIYDASAQCRAQFQATWGMVSRTVHAILGNASTRLLAAARICKFISEPERFISKLLHAIAAHNTASILVTSRNYARRALSLTLWLSHDASVLNSSGSNGRGHSVWYQQHIAFNGNKVDEDGATEAVHLIDGLCAAVNKLETSPERTRLLNIANTANQDLSHSMALHQSTKDKPYIPMRADALLSLCRIVIMGATKQVYSSNGELEAPNAAQQQVDRATRPFRRKVIQFMETITPSQRVYEGWERCTMDPNQSDPERITKSIIYCRALQTDTVRHYVPPNESAMKCAAIELESAWKRRFNQVEDRLLNAEQITDLNDLLISLKGTIDIGTDCESHQEQLIINRAALGGMIRTMVALGRQRVFSEVPWLLAMPQIYMEMDKTNTFV